MHDGGRFTIPRAGFEAAYLGLYRSGELERRAEHAVARLKDCDLCPRACGADRTAGGPSVCKTGRYAEVSSYFPHHGEEDCLRGRRGSGTIFFTKCGLRCVFCQNYDISHATGGRETTPDRLAEMMLELQGLGCHNINLVTPEHVVPQALEALALAARGGLTLPLVYNTSAYDTLDTLRLLDGVVDVYMPDFKMWDAANAKRYLHAAEYPEVARAATKEMHRQVGPLRFDENGIALRGVLVRHLVMPGGVAGTPKVLRFLAEEVSPDTYVNVMAQYHPEGQVSRDRFSEINRSVTWEEYESAIRTALDLRLRLDRRDL